MRRTGIPSQSQGRAFQDDTAPLGTRTLQSQAPPPGRRDGAGGGGDGGDDEGGEPSPGRGRRAAKRRKPLWRRVLFWTATTLALLITGLAVAGWLYIRHLNDNLTKDELNLGDNPLEGPEPNAAGQVPLNILLLGTDSRESTRNEELGGGGDLGGSQRADTQILLHASADRSNMTLVSVPRDTQVTIPRCTDPDTGTVYPEVARASINSSLDHGGPGCTVATWELLTGIPIDHFMMVDFEGVVDMADAVGGVPVCVDANVHDPDSGLRLTEGEHVIEGEQALQWLRTRHGFENGSDIGRTKAQQMYLSNMARELQSSASLTDPGELMDLAEAATSALTVDHGLGAVDKLYDLGEDLRQVPNKRINMITMPWLPDPENPEVTVIPDPVAAEDLFALVREDIPLDRPGQAAEAGNDEQGPEPHQTGEADPDPAGEADPAAEIALAVRNGTGSTELPHVDGRAAELTEELIRLGFASAVTDATLVTQERTAMLYPTEDDEANAAAVAQALGLPGSAVQLSPDVAQVTLVIGADWREGLSYPADRAGEGGDDGGSGDSGGTGGTGGSGGGGGTTFEQDEIISGLDEKPCMEVNSYYTW